MKELFEQLDTLPEFINPIFVIDAKKSATNKEVEEALFSAADEQQKVSSLINQLSELDAQAAKETPEGF